MEDSACGGLHKHKHDHRGAGTPHPLFDALHHPSKSLKSLSFSELMTSESRFGIRYHDYLVAILWPYEIIREIRNHDYLATVLNHGGLQVL